MSAIKGTRSNSGNTVSQSYTLGYPLLWNYADEALFMGASTSGGWSVLSPGHAARTQDRQGRDGPEAGRPVVLDVAARLGLQRNAATRFARGRARKSPWCAVNHRRNDWASRSPSTGEFEEVIMIEVAIEEMVGSD